MNGAESKLDDPVAGIVKTYDPELRESGHFPDRRARLTRRLGNLTLGATAAVLAFIAGYNLASSEAERPPAAIEQANQPGDAAETEQQPRYGVIVEEGDTMHTILETVVPDMSYDERQAFIDQQKEELGVDDSRSLLQPNRFFELGDQVMERHREAVEAGVITADSEAAERIISLPPPEQPAER